MIAGSCDTDGGGSWPTGQHCCYRGSQVDSFDFITTIDICKEAKYKNQIESWNQAPAKIFGQHCCHCGSQVGSYDFYQLHSSAGFL